ncbi:hypothetical protein CEXT_410841 [Caerostris extrusa]|uniref:Uncharacterized protein n=1 Tax=Caerostris extrusa TaxID=172846 RepID=A0AAV4N9J4_CAEEX|nr:hypothetical protein CEXT_410841 [Caerostris extrusa]
MEHFVDSSALCLTGTATCRSVPGSSLCRCSNRCSQFMPPVTSPHWKGVRLADSYGSVCPRNGPISKMRQRL